MMYHTTLTDTIQNIVKIILIDNLIKNRTELYLHEEKTESSGLDIK